MFSKKHHDVIVQACQELQPADNIEKYLPSLNEIDSKTSEGKAGEYEAWLRNDYPKIPENIKKQLAPLARLIAYQLALGELDIEPGSGRFKDFAVALAFRYLHPNASALRILPGEISETDFLDGKYYFFGSSSSPIIIPKPQNPAAIAAYDKIDPTSSDPQKDFWIILYPNITLCDMEENTLWPPYGHGIIDLANNRVYHYGKIYHLAQTPDGYKQVAKTLAKEILEEVQIFYPGHEDFWNQDQKENRVTQDEKNLIEKLNRLSNYGDFFKCLRDDLLIPYNARNTPNSEFDISLEGIEYLRKYFAPYLMGFYHYTESLPNKMRKQLINSTTANLAGYGSVSLVSIVFELLNPHENKNTHSCFSQNEAKLHGLLDWKPVAQPNKNSQAIKSLLEQIDIDRNAFNERALPSSGRQKSLLDVQSIENMGRDAMIYAIINEKNAQRISYQLYVKQYLKIQPHENKAMTLYNFIYQIHMKEPERAICFLDALLGKPHDVSLLLSAKLEEYLKYTWMILSLDDRLDKSLGKQALIKKISNKEIILSLSDLLSIFEYYPEIRLRELLPKNFAAGETTGFKMEDFFKVCAYLKDDEVDILLPYYREDLDALPQVEAYILAEYIHKQKNPETRIKLFHHFKKDLLPRIIDIETINQIFHMLYPVENGESLQGLKISLNREIFKTSLIREYIGKCESGEIQLSPYIISENSRRKFIPDLEKILRVQPRIRVTLDTINHIVEHFTQILKTFDEPKIIFNYYQNYMNFMIDNGHCDKLNRLTKICNNVSLRNELIMDISLFYSQSENFNLYRLSEFLSSCCKDTPFVQDTMNQIFEHGKNKLGAQFKSLSELRTLLETFPDKSQEIFDILLDKILEIIRNTYQSGSNDNTYQSGSNDFFQVIKDLGGLAKYHPNSTQLFDAVKDYLLDFPDNCTARRVGVFLSAFPSKRAEVYSLIKDRIPDYIGKSSTEFYLTSDDCLFRMLDLFPEHAKEILDGQAKRENLVLSSVSALEDLKKHLKSFDSMAPTIIKDFVTPEMGNLYSRDYYSGHVLYSDSELQKLVNLFSSHPRVLYNQIKSFFENEKTDETQERLVTLVFMLPKDEEIHNEILSMVRENKISLHVVLRKCSDEYFERLVGEFPVTFDLYKICQKKLSVKKEALLLDKLMLGIYTAHDKFLMNNDSASWGQISAIFKEKGMYRIEYRFIQQCITSYKYFESIYNLLCKERGNDKQPMTQNSIQMIALMLKGLENQLNVEQNLITNCLNTDASEATMLDIPHSRTLLSVMQVLFQQKDDPLICEAWALATEPDEAKRIQAISKACAGSPTASMLRLSEPSTQNTLLEKITQAAKGNTL